MAFLDFLTEEIAIDLGTANTLIIHNDKVVVDSPSIVARDRTSGKIIAVGREANMMQGKTHCSDYPDCSRWGWSESCRLDHAQSVPPG